jgi:signal transduction histidine kinase
MPDETSTSTPDDFLTVANRLLSLSLTQHASRDFLCETLLEAVRLTGGKRAFLARVVQETGELAVEETAGEGWTAEIERIRLQPHNETHRGITGYVAITGEPYLCRDVRVDPHYVQFFAEVRSEVAVPFSDAEGRVSGVLHVDSEEVDHFCEEHLIWLTTLANAMAAALAFEEYRSRERLLVQIGRDLAATSEIEPLARRVVDVAAEALRCEGCSLFLLDEAREALVLQATRGYLLADIGTAFYRLGEGLTGTVGLTGQTIRLDDPREDPRWKGRYPEFSPDERSAFLAVPIIGRERTLGVLRVSRPRATPAWFRARFTESDERVLTTIAGQVGIAVDNVRNFNRVLRSERMAAWGELSAKSAHMIGNRTFAIKGDLNELKYLLTKCLEPQALAHLNMNQEVGALVESIERGVYRLEEILREFRDFVMATQLTLRPTDIVALVQATVLETFPKRGPVQLVAEYAPGLPELRCDGEKLKRAFGELIENAVSFMPEGGTLTVRVDSIAPGGGPSGVRLSPSRTYLQITFADTGPGVSEELKEKIFTPFFSSRVKGMGLGLSIVKGIVDAHHGKIRETGEPGLGAQFLIFLPIESDN